MLVVACGCLGGVVASGCLWLLGWSGCLWLLGLSGCLWLPVVDCVKGLPLVALGKPIAQSSFVLKMSTRAETREHVQIQAHIHIHIQVPRFPKPSNPCELVLKLIEYSPESLPESLKHWC